MLPETKSILLFIFGCLPVRILSVWIAKKYPNTLPIMSILAFVIAVGFSAIYIFKLRKTGLETFGEKIWWNDLRPVHALLYFTFSYMAIYFPDNAWIALAVDTFIGASAFGIHRIINS